MKLQFAENYQGDKKKQYPFPSDNLPQSAKDDEKYFRQAAQAIVTRYLNNLCEIPYTKFESQHTISELRAYAYGKQGSDRYKNYIIGQVDPVTGCRRKSTINISWKTLDILPKKLGDVKGYMQKLKYDIITSAIDPQAVFSKDMVKAATKVMTNDLMKNLHAEINEKAGGMAVSPEGQLVGQTGAVPFQNEEQVEGFAATGGFQLLQEIAIKILLDKTDYDSGQEIIDDLIIEDLLHIGKCGKVHYTENGSDNVLYDHVDMERAIVPWSKYADFRDATYSGMVPTWTIGRLRKESNLSEDDIIKIAHKYNDASINSANKLPNFYQNVQDSKDAGLGIAVLDSIQVDVAVVEWLGNKTFAQTKVTRSKEGNIALNTVSDDYELKEADKKRGKELNKYTHQTVYKCKMILGTDFIFDYGIQNDIPYKKNDKGQMCPVLSFNFYKLTGPSLTERCMGFVDDANIALFKKRMIMKNLTTGHNIRINASAFENVKINGKLQQPQDLMALFRDEGFLIVDDKNPWGQNNGSSRPIDIIPSDVAQRLLECRNDLEWNIKMIEEITGLNAVFSASTPNTETGLGVSKIAINATENSIFTIVSARKNHYEKGLSIAANKWKVKAAFMDDKKRDNFATDRSMQYIRIGKEIAWHDYGIRIESGVSEDEKLMLMQRVTQLADLRRQSGTGGIKPSDELMIFEIIKTGNIKLARLTLAQIEEYREQEDEKKAEKRYQENAQLQQQSNQQASQNKQAEIQTEAQAAGSQKMMEIQAEMQLEQVKAENKRKEIALQNVFGWGLDTYNKTVK